MSKVSMPEPEAFLYVIGKHRGVSLNFRSDMELSEGTVRHALITTDQAEAYADARVREALEMAASLCDELAGNDENSAEYAGCAAHSAVRIRALIPNMTTKNTGGPAFPSVTPVNNDMTLRDAMALSVRMPDEFAASWAAALVGSPQPGLGAEPIEHIDWWARAEAAYRYRIANAMLKAREEE